jgi:uncharacterized membrane protein
MLISLLITLIFVGVALYLIGLIPMDPTIAKVIRVVVIVVALLWVLSVFGLLPNSWFSSSYRLR